MKVLLESDLDAAIAYSAKLQREEKSTSGIYALVRKLREERGIGGVQRWLDSSDASELGDGVIAYKIAAHSSDVALGIPGSRDWDDDLTRARAALNWEKHFDLAFDSDTARAFHDEDLDVDTDFCAMCGHDWCSVRISKEIVEFESGKASGFERERVMKSPALSPEQQEILRSRGHLSPDEIHRLASKTHDAVGGAPKAACHSDLVSNETEALRVQREKLLQLGRKGNEGAPRP